MPFQLLASDQLADTTITTTTETVVWTSLAYSNSGPGAQVTIFGMASVTAGTGTTAFVTRVRRGTAATGTLVGEAITVSVTAGNIRTVNITVPDNPGEIAGGHYVITVQQTGATGDATVSYSAGVLTVG